MQIDPFDVEPAAKGRTDGEKDKHRREEEYEDDEMSLFLISSWF